MYIRVLHLIERGIVPSFPRISLDPSITTIRGLMRVFQRPATVILVTSLYWTFTSITSSRDEEFRVDAFPPFSVSFNPTTRHVPRALTRWRVIVERIIGAIIRREHVVWMVVGSIYTSVCWASAVGVRRVEWRDASTTAVEGGIVEGGIMTQIARAARRGNGAMVMMMHGLGYLGDRMQTIETFARIASRAMCGMSGSSGQHILVA